LKIIVYVDFSTLIDMKWKKLPGFLRRYFTSDFTEKSPSVWDDFLHEKKLKETIPLPPQKKRHEFIFKGTKPQGITEYINGDVACDSYHKVEEDVKNLVDLGVRICTSVNDCK